MQPPFHLNDKGALTPCPFGVIRYRNDSSEICPIYFCWLNRSTQHKSLCWGFKLQGLTWSFIELTSHFVQIGLRVHRQVSALRKVLSQQAIGVLVRPALPRALRIAKIYVDFGRQRKATMIRKFLSPVPGQGLIQLTR